MSARSIPGVALVDFATLLGTELAEFILEGHLAVALLLVLDVADEFRALRFTDREDAVAALPVETAECGALCLQPLGRAGFEFFDELGNGDLAGEVTEDVDVVFDAVNGEAGAVEGFEDRDEVGVQFLADTFVFEEWLAIFR